jgi:hypothetical protein
LRRPTSGGKPPKAPRNQFAAKAAPAPPAPRRLDFERIVAEAIDARRLLSLHYDDDMMARTFQPAVLYHSSGDKVCVSGLQIGNPVEPRENGEPRVFEVGKMRSVEVTDQPFGQLVTFDRFDKRYAGGIIKSV